MPHRQGARQQGAHPNREKRVFEKRRFNHFSSNAESPSHQKTDRYAVHRRQALNKLIAESDQGIARVALLCELSENRVRSLSEGVDPLDSHLAMHIEVSLGLPSGWLDRGAEGDVPDEVKKFLREGKPGQKQEVDWADLVTDETVVMLDTPGQPKQDGEFDAFVEAIGSEAQKDDLAALPPYADSRIGDTAGVGSEKSEERFVSQVSEGVEDMNQNVQYAAAAHHTADNPTAQEAADAVPVYLMIKEFFPAVRAFLSKNTDLSAATISGALSGSRQLTPQNARMFEHAMGLPEGWLEKQMTFEKAKKEFEKYAPHLLNMAPPRRGRRPGQPAPRKARVAEVQASTQLPPATRFDVPAQAATPAPEQQSIKRTTLTARRPDETRQLQGARAEVPTQPGVSPQIAPQPTPVPQPTASATPAVQQAMSAPHLAGVGSENYTLAQAFAKTIETMVAQDQLDNRKVAQLLGVLYS